MIDWFAFFVVLFATLGGASLVVTLYSLGLRFVSSTAAQGRGRFHALGVTCFVLCALVVLYGVYLVIPYFHQ